jgi:hypothetical protein
VDASGALAAASSRRCPLQRGSPPGGIGRPTSVIGHCDVAPWNIVARQLVAIVDAYGLPVSQRGGFFGQIVEFVVSETAWEANDAGVTPEMTSHPVALWAMAWRARAAAWLLQHRRTFETALAQRSA